MNPDQQIIINLLKEKQITGTFVEVGTWKGAFAADLLKKINPVKLYCVDPYKYFSDFSYKDCMNLKLQVESERIFQNTKSILEKISPNTFEIVRATSMEAVRRFQDNSLDFVYIDANHEYNFVLEDILEWYKKVKPGGILAGDDVISTNITDYNINNNILKEFDKSKRTWGYFGVYPAVKKAEEILEVSFTIQGTQFYLIK